MRNFFLAALLASVAGTAAAQDILGFNEAESEIQRSLEIDFDSGLNRQEMDEWLKLLSTTPHHVGSPASKENALFIADLFKSWGYAVEIEEYEILLPTPKVLPY